MSKYKHRIIKRFLWFPEQVNDLGIYKTCWLKNVYELQKLTEHISPEVAGHGDVKSQWVKVDVFISKRIAEFHKLLEA